MGGEACIVQNYKIEVSESGNQVNLSSWTKPDQRPGHPIDARSLQRLDSSKILCKLSENCKNSYVSEQI